MLCQFTVKNFKSFKDEATLDLQATNISEHEDKIIVRENDNEKYLPLAAIYGPNGGGKSNIIKALFGLTSKIMRPICAACEDKDCSSNMLKVKNYIVPFKFNDKTIAQPTEFEIYFRTKNNSEYKYYLSVKDEIVIEENLFVRDLNEKKEIQLFQREQNKRFDINKSVLKEVNISGLTETLPLLSYLGLIHRDVDLVKDIFYWIEKLVIFNSSTNHYKFNSNLDKSKKFKERFLKMMKEMDIDIDDYRFEESQNKYEVYTKHILNGVNNELELNEESNGTIKLFELLPHVLESLIYGSTIVVDELDARLHPKLLEYIIELFRNPKKNKKGAQLIFTSHDLMTMTDDLLRRDEIWFVAKNNEQASQIYSLIEFKKENGKPPRKDENFGKQYLEGRYGADPYLKRMINWGE